VILYWQTDQSSNEKRNGTRKDRWFVITIESNPRDPNSLGLSLDAVGIGLFMIGLSLVVLAPLCSEKRRICHADLTLFFG
jgi:hypothetical protein